MYIEHLLLPFFLGKATEAPKDLLLLFISKKDVIYLFSKQAPLHLHTEPLLFYLTTFSHVQSVPPHRRIGHVWA